MAEISPPEIKLTSTEHYQAQRRNPNLPEDGLLALSWRIATQPTLYHNLIPNPYTRDSLQLIATSFPDVSPADVIRATVLAEPEGAYDRNFRQLPHQEQREALYQQIDESVTITMRLERYLQKRPEAFWDMPDDRIYTLLSEVAFGSPDEVTTQRNFAQNQRRGFRLSIVNFIEDLKMLKPYRDQFTADPRTAASRIFGKELGGKVEAETLPIGFVIYLDEADYYKLSPPKEVGHAPGGTLADWDNPAFPQELSGKVIIINRDFQVPGQAEMTRNHELRHMVFAGFVAERDSVYALDTEQTLEELQTPQDHKKYAEVLRKSFSEYARNEIIAYFGSGDVDYKFLGQLGGDKWLSHLEKIRNYLWVKGDITPEQKASLYSFYTDHFANYLAQIREYQWIALRLFHSEMGLETAEALLQVTPFDKARRLGRYFSVDPDEIPNEIDKEQTQILKRFASSVDNLTQRRLGRSSLSEQPMTSWSRLMDWDAQSQVRLTYPREAVPSLLKSIEGFSEPDVVDEALYSTELILYMHHKEMSQQELGRIKGALQNMVRKRNGADFTRVRTAAANIIQNIDEVYVYGGVDFIHHEPLVAIVANTIKAPEGQLPTVDQISKLIELLRGKDAITWNEFFKPEYADLLTGPDAIPVAIRLADATSYAGFTVKALAALEANPASLGPEARGQALGVIESILSRKYFIGNVDITDKLKPYALQVKNIIENS